MGKPSITISNNTGKIARHRAMLFFTTGRIFTDIFIVISIFFLTPWITLFSVMGAIFYFKNFYEAIVAGVLIDMLYGAPLEQFFHIQWATTLLFLFLYFSINHLKRYTRWYESR